jgi:hypothetical protein
MQRFRCPQCQGKDDREARFPASVETYYRRPRRQETGPCSGSTAASSAAFPFRSFPGRDGEGDVGRLAFPPLRLLR